MKWLLLAVLLAVPQASPPASGPTPDKTAPTQQGTEVQDNSSTPPAAPSQPAPDTSKTKPDENSGAAAKPDVSLKPVEISKWPPVSIPKGWTDYTYWAFGLLLVVVGFLQVRLLSKTLGAINDQAQTMKDQARTMKDQAQIMDQQSKATEEAAKAATLSAKAAIENIQLLINKERARIRVEPERVEIPKQGDGIFARAANRVADSPKTPIIYYKIFCYGTTPAFIVDSSSNVEITARNEPPAAHDYTLPIHELPPVMLPNAEGLQRINFAFDRPKVSLGHIAEAISKGDMFLHFWGFISYKIPFDDDVHQTGFRYIYGIKDTFLMGFDLGIEPSWWKAGEEQDNHET